MATIPFCLVLGEGAYLFQGSRTSLGTLTVVITGISRHPDCADDLAIDEEGNTTFHRHCSFKAEDPTTCTACRKHVLQCSGQSATNRPKGRNDKSNAAQQSFRQT
jgi:hypothetical protein